MLPTPELKQVHPLGKSTVIEDQGFIVAETGAIVQHLVESAGGRLGPPSPRDDALRYHHFLHYAERSLMPPLLVRLMLNRAPLFGKLVQRKFQPMIEVHLDYVEAKSTQRPWFAGKDITAADVMMSFPLEAAAARAMAAHGRPNISAWFEKVHSRPAYQSALKAGGPYAHAQLQ